MKKFVQLLFSRLMIFSLLIFFQLLFFVALVVALAQNAVYIYSALEIISIGVVIWVISKEDNPSYKVAWITAILIVPLFGGLFYLMWGNKRLPPSLKERLEGFHHTTLAHIPRHLGVEEELQALDPQLAIQAEYIRRVSGFPVWNHTESAYLPLGEDFFRSLMEELQKAKSFILMEYFIIEEGEMWDPIFALLTEKAAAGVEVRFLYDDVGCIQTIPTGYYKTMIAAGIHTAVFNPFTPHLSLAMNYRDHRKICVIDGNIGYCGGINLADEYINAYPKHGHWKDTAVLLRGEGVWNLTLMFLTLWQFTTKEELPFDRYLPTLSPVGMGYVQPFGDSPLDNLNVSECAYMQMIGRACRYVYITTPYLILDNEMVTALTIAAQSGVDVRIITPHQPDKWFVHSVTRAYYPPLLKAGVRIFEYTHGFVHAKMFVSDDKAAIVGTTNMDYRSFYLHFECGVAFYHSPLVGQVKEDIIETLALCQEVTLGSMAHIPFPVRFVRSVLRIFAPLM